MEITGSGTSVLHYFPMNSIWVIKSSTLNKGFFFTKLIWVVKWPQVPFMPFMGWVWVTTVGWFGIEDSFSEENILNGSQKNTLVLWFFVKSLSTGQCFAGLLKLYFPSGEFPTMQHTHKDLGDGSRGGVECLLQHWWTGEAVEKWKF